MLANGHGRPPAARLAPQNRQPHTNTQVQKLQTLEHLFEPYAFVGRFQRLGDLPPPCSDFILPGYFPSGGLGARLYRERYASLRVFTP